MTTEKHTRLNEIRNDVLETGRNVWLAGLGAVATVNDRSKVLFAELVDRGEKLEKKERGVLSRRWEKTGKEVKDLGHKLETRIEKSMSATVERFGVPSRREVQGLIQRIEELTQKVETLTAN